MKSFHTPKKKIMKRPSNLHLLNFQWITVQSCKGKFVFLEEFVVSVMGNLALNHNKVLFNNEAQNSLI